MVAMFRRLNIPAVVTIAAMVLACVAMLTLSHVDAEITGVVIIVLVLIAGTGVGFSVASPGARR
jgi:hypothetical protein